MSAIPTVFEGEVQLLRWSETSNQGATITLQLADPADLERFKVMTLAKGKQAGQRLMTAMVEIGDDEQPVGRHGETRMDATSTPDFPQKTADSAPSEKPGQLCIMACTFCTDPVFWHWINNQAGYCVGDESEAKQFILDDCHIGSRKELDVNPGAAEIFHHKIRIPFMKWRDARRAA